MGAETYAQLHTVTNKCCCIVHWFYKLIPYSIVLIGVCVMKLQCMLVTSLLSNATSHPHLRSSDYLVSKLMWNYSTKATGRFAEKEVHFYLGCISATDV